jgi:hypothetical protein
MTLTNDFNIVVSQNDEDNTENIIYSLVGKPLKAGMPMTIGIIGHSRAGKSLFGLKIQDVIYKKKGLDFANYVEECVLIKPVHYAKKTKAILEGKGIHKDICSLQMDEAKFLIDSGDWNTIKNKAIRTIAATSASIKPILFIVVAQHLSDMDAKTRKSLDLLFTVQRSYGQRPIIKGQTFYEKIYDIDRISVKPRSIRGIVHEPIKNTASQVFPIFRPTLPRKEVLDKYLSFEQSDKKDEIFELLDNIEKEAEKLSGKNTDKLKQLAEHLVNNPDELANMGDFTKSKGWRISKDAKQRYNYGSKEFKQIEEFVKEKLKENKLKQGGVVDE